MRPFLLVSFLQRNMLGFLLSSHDDVFSFFLLSFLRSTNKRIILDLSVSHFVRRTQLWPGIPMQAKHYSHCTADATCYCTCRVPRAVDRSHLGQITI